jgi:hypothetical protein
MTEILVELRDYYVIGELVSLDGDLYEVIEIDEVNQLAVLEKVE